MKNKIIIIWSCAGLLLITFFLSFIKSPKKDNRKAIKSTLLNPKNISSLTSFEIESNDEFIKISKDSNDLWIVSSKNSKNYLYAEQTKVDSFIIYISSIINMYKISDNSLASEYGFYDKNRISLKYYISDNTYTQLLFGVHDFSLENRYLNNTKNTTVYEISSDINKFLNYSIQNWAEPYIIPKIIIGNNTYKDIQKIKIKFLNDERNLSPEKNSNFYDYAKKVMELRHGGFINTDMTSVQSIPETIILEFGDKSQLTLKIFKGDQENEFIILLDYINPIKNTTYQQVEKISNWTYLQLKNFTEE